MQVQLLEMRVKCDIGFPPLKTKKQILYCSEISLGKYTHTDGSKACDHHRCAHTWEGGRGQISATSVTHAEQCITRNALLEVVRSAQPALTSALDANNPRGLPTRSVCVLTVVLASATDVILSLKGDA